MISKIIIGVMLAATLFLAYTIKTDLGKLNTSIAHTTQQAVQQAG